MIHTTNNFPLLAELPLEGFKWKGFSYSDTLKHNIHLFFNFIFCKLLNKHDWVIQVIDWDFDEVNTVEKFRLHCARNLKCSCCEKIVDIDNADLNWTQKVWYDHFTKNYFNYNY
jgi:hypothetical protein